MGGRIFAYWPKLRTHPVGHYYFIFTIYNLIFIMFSVFVMFTATFSSFLLSYYYMYVWLQTLV